MSRWSRVSLGEIAQSVDYGVTASASHTQVGPKFLRITDIQDGRVDWDSVPWCVCDARESLSSRLQPGDIVFARTGATTGKSYLINDCPPEAVFASYLIRLRLGPTIEPRFVSHFFQSADYWNQITRGARGAAQPGVNATTLRSLEVPLPPLPVQRRIANILDQADALRAKRRAALAHLDELNQAVFIDMFGDPALNPMDWPMKSVGSVAAKFSDGPFGSNLKSSHYVESGIRVVRLQNIGVGRFVDEDKAYISREHFEDLRKHECLPGDQCR